MVTHCTSHSSRSAHSRPLESRISQRSRRLTGSGILTHKVRFATLLSAARARYDCCPLVLSRHHEHCYESYPTCRSLMPNPISSCLKRWVQRTLVSKSAVPRIQNTIRVQRAVQKRPHVRFPDFGRSEGRRKYGLRPNHNIKRPNEEGVQLHGRDFSEPSRWPHQQRAQIHIKLQDLP